MLHIAENVAVDKGILRKGRISGGWWRRFLERNPGMSLRAGDATAGVRIDAINEDNMRKYFDLLEEVFDELDLKNHPERIYNMDETGMPLDPRPPKVVAPKGQKKVRYRCSGQKSQITIIGCGNAIGQTVPPYIIFAAKQLNHLWMKDEVPGSRYAVSDNGWIDQDLFYFWMTEHFLNHAVAGRPLLLLLDGHSSHFKPETIKFAKDHGIMVFCLPPHTTHECQPLDCSFFGPLKVHWRNVCHSFHQKHPTAVISKLNFNCLFKEAWLRAITPQVLASGFAKAGVYPLNRAQISISSGNSLPGTTSSSGDGDDGGNSHSLSDNSDVSSSSITYPAGGDKNDVSLSSDPSVNDVGDADRPGYSLAPGDGYLPGNSTSRDNVLSPGIKALYKRRYEEGYDIFDPAYTIWLQQHHPEASSPSLTTPTTSNPLSTTSTPSSNQLSKSTSKPGGINQQSTPLSDLTNRISSPYSSSASTNGSVMSKFLGGLPVKTPSRPLTAKISEARVLTSAECLELLQEKQERKRRDKEEKEQRKLTRELNKKRKEEEQRKKVQERAKKAAQRQAEKEKKEAEKAMKQVEKIAKKSKQQSTSVSRKRPTVTDDPGQDHSIRQKYPKLSPEHIDPNQCCACFGLFEDDIGMGSEWLQCSCTRWIHEECVEDVVRNENGEEKLCPLCLSTV